MQVDHDSRASSIVVTSLLTPLVGHWKISDLFVACTNNMVHVARESSQCINCAACATRCANYSCKQNGTVYILQEALY